MSWAVVSGSGTQLASLLSVVNIFINKCSLKMPLLTAVHPALVPHTEVAERPGGRLQQVGSHHVSSHLLLLAT